MKRAGFILVLSLSFGTAHEHAKESELTLKQVMQMVNLSAIKMLQGFMLNNDALILEGAREIAEHPMPRGGPLRYIDPSKREDFARLMPTFERQVHGGAEDILRFIKEGKREKAFNTYIYILQGCMSCHELFKNGIKER
ncbi:MAG: hypothetical protein ACK4OF_05250 [Aquificaceae bacterium]